MIINKDCYLIDGAKKSAIYDLKNEKVYSINQDAKIIIEKVIKSQKLKPEEKEFINKLKKLKLFDENNFKEDDDRELFKKPILNFAWLELTESCNLNCVHCYGKFGNPQILRII